MDAVKLQTVWEWIQKEGFLESGDVSGTAEHGPQDAIERVSQVVADHQNLVLTGFASIDKASSQDVSFFAGNLKSETNANGYSAAVIAQVKAGLLFVPTDVFGKVKLPNVAVMIPVKNPYHVMVEFLKKFVEDVDGNACFGEPSGTNAGVAKIAPSAKIHRTAVVEGTVEDGAFIGPNCVVMSGSVVGTGSVLEAGVTIYPHVKLGKNCICQAGVVIGSRGFGFYEYEGKRRMVPHVAGVQIGDNCSFGANTVVAAGFISPTTIGNNCHFDSMVQIAHNCVVGNNVYMASQTALAGSVTLEDDVEFAGGAKAAGHLTIGKGAHVAAKAGVTKSVPAGRTVSGFPAVDVEIWRRQMVELRIMAKKKLKK